MVRELLVGKKFCEIKKRILDRKMKPVEIVLSRSGERIKEKNGGGESS
jgi:hypothetical protein